MAAGWGLVTEGAEGAADAAAAADDDEAGAVVGVTRTGDTALGALCFLLGNIL